MKRTSQPDSDRRKLLKLMGGSVAFVSMGGIVACSDGGTEPAAPSKPPEPPKPAAPQPESLTSAPVTPEPAPAETGQVAADVPEPEPAPAPPTEPAVADASDVVQLSESNPQAQALGYRTDSSTVDAGKHPNHAPDQACANCALYVGVSGDDWGPCGIFPGKQVNAGGWCSAYSKKA